MQVQEQIKTLNMKLDELRVEHQTNEATGESVISCLNDKLSEVRWSCIIRIIQSVVNINTFVRDFVVLT